MFKGLTTLSDLACHDKAITMTTVESYPKRIYPVTAALCHTPGHRWGNLIGNSSVYAIDQGSDDETCPVTAVFMHSPGQIWRNLPGNSSVYDIHQGADEENKPSIETHSLWEYSIENGYPQELGELLTKWKGGKQCSWNEIDSKVAI